MEVPKPSSDLAKLRLPTGDAPPKRVHARYYDPVAIATHFEPLMKLVRCPTPDERWAKKTFAPFVWKGDESGTQLSGP
jgi:hypothetical protein